MASTNKTTNLGLNNWTESDCPKRADFVSDNIIIDAMLGNHIKDSSLHLTADEKDRVSAPYSINTYYGTGEESTRLKYNYIPSIVLVCKKNSAFQTVSGSNVKMNAGIASLIGTTGGLLIEDNYVVVSQSEEAINGVFYNLNESAGEYLVIAFK